MTPHFRAMLTEQPVGRYFPVVFANGDEWTSVTCTCAECGDRIADKYLRGNITVPFKAVAVMDAVGYCDRCNVVSPYHIRYGVRGDVGMWTGTGYRWLRTARETWWSRLQRWLNSPVAW